MTRQITAGSLTDEERRLLASVQHRTERAKEAQQERVEAILVAFEAWPLIPRPLIAKAAGVTPDAVKRLARKHGRRPTPPTAG
jgi:hypothetical protein